MNSSPDGAARTKDRRSGRKKRRLALDGAESAGPESSRSVPESLALDPAEKAPAAVPAVESEREELPAFARGFPDDPALSQLVQAFSHGNYALVRHEAPRLAESGATRAIREAATELRRRVDPDPMVRTLVIIAFLLLGFLVLWTYSKGH